MLFQAELKQAKDRNQSLLQILTQGESKLFHF